MTEFELEEGEAYFPQDDDYGDDGYIDPDKDLSYIDKKIENVLGHYQKDFMGGLSAESLGARYGGYGSFLPMQQRSPAILSSQKTQSQITSESPNNLPAENSTVVANHSLPLKSVTSSVQALRDSRTCTMNNQAKLQSSHDGSSKIEQNKPMVHHTAPKALKLRVKMGESVYPRNNSSIYSGLGLDMSPCSSLEGSSSDSYGCSPGMQEIKAESPSYIVKTMTSFPLLNKEILSPLHHIFVGLERKNKANKDRKSKATDPSKDRKSNKEQRKERKANKLQVKPAELVKENREFPTSKEAVLSKVSSDAAHSYISDKKYEVGYSEEVTEKSTQKVEVARDKAKRKFEATPSRDFVVPEKGIVKVPKGKMKEENFTSITSKESHTGQKNENGLRDKVNNVVIKSKFANEVCVYEKGNAMRKKTVEDQQVGHLPMRDVDEKVKSRELSGKVHHKGEALTPMKQESHSKVMHGLKEHSLSLAKSKSRGSQTDGKSKRDGVVNLQRDTRKDGGVAANVNLGKKEIELNMKEVVLGVSGRGALALECKPKEKLNSTKKGFDSNIGINMEGLISGGNFVTERMPVGDVAPSVVEDWVQCERCDKWRLLPLGMNPDSLPKEWICSMLTWLPGKNSCSVSEEETNDDLHALPQVPVLGLPMQNVQLSYPNGTASLHASAGAISSGGRKKNSVVTKINAFKQNGLNEHIPVKKNHLHSGQIKGSKHQKKLIGEFDASGSTGDFKPSTIEKKRMTEYKASGVLKKIKRVPQQSMENDGLTIESQSYALGAQSFSNDFTRSSESLVKKAKDRSLSDTMTARNIEKTDVSQKKRKSNDQLESVVSTENLSGETGHPVNNWSTVKNSGTENRKEKKLKVSNMNCSERELPLGLSENATNSSSSKVSLKIRAKVKCSPAESISSSPSRISKSDHCNKPEKFSAKKLKPKAEAKIHETVVRNKEDTRDQKSNLTRISGIMSDVNENPKLEGPKNTGGKLNRVIQETGTLVSQDKLIPENRDPKSMKKNSSEKGKSHLSQRSSEKDHALHSRVLSETARVDNRIIKVEPMEASSSMKKEVFRFDTNATLKEATIVRDSSDSVKVSGSGRESNGVLFQAALSFLHGASLLEPGSNEGGKYSEMTPTAAYSTSARLCEQRAREYERCNDMASASLAYKCMEVAYMNVVYSKDLSARRDRVALDMAIRAAPQVSAVESPSSSASDIDSLNNQVIGGTSRDGKSVLDQQNHVIYAGNRPNFVRLLNFTQHVNLAMEASRRSQTAFAAAKPALIQARKGEVVPLIKSVLDFSFHDIDGLLRLMRIAMEALNAKSRPN